MGPDCVAREVVKGVPERLVWFGVACEKTIDGPPVRGGLENSGAEPSAPEFEVTRRLAVGSDDRGFRDGMERDIDAAAEAGADRRRLFGFERFDSTGASRATRFEEEVALARVVAGEVGGRTNGGFEV